MRHFISIQYCCKKPFLISIICMIGLITMYQCHTTKGTPSSTENIVKADHLALLSEIKNAQSSPIIRSNGELIFFLETNATAPILMGDLTGWSKSGIPMRKIEDTKYWYYMDTVPLGARLEYKYKLSDETWISDPLNKRKGAYENSIIEMPQYQPAPFATFKAKAIHGKIVHDSIQDDKTGIMYNYHVYLPFDYSDENQYPTCYFHDGQEFLALAQAKNTIDNLIDAKLVKSFIGVFLEPHNRNEEYAFTKRSEFTQFVTEQFVPFIDAHYSTEKTHRSRAVIGPSFGGHIAVWLAYQNPSMFYHCGAYSVSYWPNEGELLNFVQANSHLDVDYFAIWGLYDGVRKNNHALIQYFDDNKIPYQAKEYPEGHSWSLWKNHLHEMLIAFFPFEN